MKNKKILVMFITISMCLGLVACKKNESEMNLNNPSNTEKQNQTSEISDEKLASIEALQQEFSELEIQFPEEVSEFIPYFHSIDKYLKDGENANYLDYGVSSLLNSIDSSEDYFAKMSYLMKDLNGDGEEEFLLYYNSEELDDIILSMYTMSGDDCYCILNSQENMRFSLCENDVIKMELLNEEYTGFCKLNKNFKLDTLDFVEKITPEADAKNIFDKYKEVDLELKKLK